MYNPGARGPATPADRLRDIDRVHLPEEIESLEKSPDRFAIPETPRYFEMVDRVCAMLARPPREFRVFRLRMSYPVSSFQYVIAFDAPARPITA